MKKLIIPGKMPDFTLPSFSRWKPWIKQKNKPIIYSINYKHSKSFIDRGENIPNDTMEPDELHSYGDKSIAILALKARDGDSDAAQLLARLARKATMFLNDVCNANPKLVRPLARNVREWPMINKIKRVELRDDEKKLFKTIQLGADDYVALDSHAQWQDDDPWGKIAGKLLYYIQVARGGSDDTMRTPGISANDNKNLSRYFTENRRRNYGEFDRFVKKTLKSEFNKKNAKKWWDLAKLIFLSKYPDPSEVKELNQLIVAKSHRKSRGKLNGKILEKIQNRFISYAPRSPVIPDKPNCDCGKPAAAKYAGDWACASCIEKEKARDHLSPT